MVNIQDIEESILIETSDFNYSVLNVVNDVRSSGKDLSDEEILKMSCNIISSMVLEGLIKVVKTKSEKKDDDVYTPISTEELSREELDFFMKNPDKWEETGVFSLTELYELTITDKGLEKV